MDLESALGVASYLGQLGRLGSTDLFQLPPHRLGQMLMNEHQVVGGAAPKNAEVAPVARPRAHRTGGAATWDAE